MNALHYIETNSHDPAFNLAFEEYLLQNRHSGDWLMLWQNDNTIVVGQNQNAAAEINRQFVKEHNIRVVRRATGGGTVYHDLGNLNYSFITDVSENTVGTGAVRFTLPVVSALKALGLDAEASGRNDILVCGKKVSGTAQRKIKNRILHHGTLLFDSDLEMLSKCLIADREKFTGKGIASVKARVSDIRPMLNSDMTIEQFKDYLIKSFAESFGKGGGQFVKESLTEKEFSEVRSIAAEKYGNDDWTWGKSLPYGFHNKMRFTGGTVQVDMSVEKGKVTDIKFSGDFLSSISLSNFEAAFTAIPARRESFERVMDEAELSELFGSITKQELLQLCFNEKEQAPCL